MNKKIFILVQHRLHTKDILGVYSSQSKLEKRLFELYPKVEKEKVSPFIKQLLALKGKPKVLRDYGEMLSIQTTEIDRDCSLFIE